MKKEEIKKMKSTLSKADFLKLKAAVTYGKIERNDIPEDLRKNLDEMWEAENKKLKKEVNDMKTPLSQQDFEKLKKALDLEEIERAAIPKEVLFNMDEMWAAENQKRYDELREDGTFGAYD